MKLYEFSTKDGVFFTRVETINPSQELEAIRKYAPEVSVFKEYLEPMIVLEEESEETDDSEEV